MSRMFKNRSVQVKMVDDRKLLEPTSPPVDISQTAAVVATSVIAVIGAYMFTDTLRQVVIHTAVTRIQ